jgi:hypothetical protein
MQVETLGVDVDGETEDRAYDDKEDAPTKSHPAAPSENPASEADGEQDKNKTMVMNVSSLLGTGRGADPRLARLVDVVRFAAVIAGALALLIHASGRRFCLVVQCRGLGLGGFRFLRQALRLCFLCGRVLAFATLLLTQAIGFGGVGLGLVAMGVRPRGTSFLLDPFPFATAA